MAPKYRISTKGKKLQKRKMKLFSLAVKARHLSVKRPCAITISTEGHSQAEIEFLQDAEAKGLITNVTWISSSPNGFDEKMKYALLYLHSDEAKTKGCKILKGYDYAWIKIALTRGPIPNRYTEHRYMSTPKFVNYIISLGFNDIAGSKTLNKAIAQVRWHSESNRLSFPNAFLGNVERRRRNLIAFKFLEIINEV